MPTETDSKVELLQQAGLSNDFISRHFGIVVERTLSPADAEIADKVRDLISYALDEARWTIKFGAPQDRAGLLKVLVARSAGLVGQEGSARIEEFYTQWDDLMASVRNVELEQDDDVIDILEET